jgi:hypothetical protein
MTYWLIPFACFISFCLGMLTEHVRIARNVTKIDEWAKSFGDQLADCGETEFEAMRADIKTRRDPLEDRETN